MNKNMLALLVASALMVASPVFCAPLTAEQASALMLKAIAGDSQALSILKQKTANGEAAEAQFIWGVIYRDGLGVIPQNYAEAANWFRMAADHGLAKAQINLGVLYDKGQGVPQDYAESVKWYRKAADQGNALAQNILGSIYFEGHGVQQDYTEAVKWYHKAADQGFAPAQYTLGFLYDNGRGDVPQDYAEAVKWYHKAADQRDADAQAGLGLMYANGRGVAEDYVQAYKWLVLSKAASNPPSKAYKLASQGIESLFVLMTPDQIARAQAEATAWAAKHTGGH